MKLEISGIRWDSHLMIRDEKTYNFLLKRFHIKSGVIRANLNIRKPKRIHVKVTSVDYRYLPYEFKTKIDKATDFTIQIHQLGTPAYKKKLQDEKERKWKIQMAKTEEERYTREPLP